MVKAAVARLLRKRFGPWSAGIDEKSTPEMIQQGRCADARNMLLDEVQGAAVPRQGSILISTLPSGLPARDCYVYIQTSGTTYLLASDGATLYYTTDPTVQASWTSLITGLTSTAFMQFETIENKVYMSNGVDAVRSWDGTNLIVYDRTFTSTTDATSVSSTTVRHASLTGATDYWINQKLVFTVGANVGTVVTITAYNSGTNTLTFTPSTSGVAVTDRFVVGLNISPALAMRVWDGHLWFFSTVSDPSEARFNRLTDQDTGTVITTDNPRAWPSANSISIYGQDGDKVWCASPVFRDRFLIAKATGIFRLERDPLSSYRIEVVTRSVGSRFHNSWAIKGEAVYFVGQRRDGYPDVFKTDMYSVDSVDPAGGIETTLRSLKQPNSAQRNILLATPGQFNAGTLSTIVKTSSSQIEVGSFDFQSSALISGSNVDNETNSGQIGVLGAPQWDVDYEGVINPVSASPAWTKTAGGSETTTGGDFEDNFSFNPPVGGVDFTRSNIFNSGQDIFAVARFYFDADYGANRFRLRVSNGVKSAQAILVQSGQGSSSFNGASISNLSTLYHTVHILLKANGTSKCWVDGVLVSSQAPTANTENACVWGSNGYAQSLRVTRIGYHANFKGDSLSVSAGVSPKALPDTLPSSGNVVMQNDMTRAPDALRNAYWTDGTGAKLATCGVTAASLTVQLANTTDMTQFAVGQKVSLRTIATGLYITNGVGQTIASINSGAFTITFDSAVGSVTTSSATGAYPYFGSLATTSWTATASDFATGTDPAGYVAVALGATPTSLAYRYQRLKVTLTKDSASVSPELLTLQTGILWVSPAEFVGAAITSWRTFTDTVSVPSGAAQTIKIRRATTSSTPAESDWGSWFTITNGDNIGTILADGTPPTTRWVQLKVEEGVSSADLNPYIQAIQIQWNEGSAATFPLVAVVRKRRYMFCAATSSAAQNDVVLVYDRNDAPMKFYGWNVNNILHFQTKLIGFDAANANVYQLDADNVYTDNGSSIDSYIVSGNESFDNLEIRKNFRYAFLHMGGQGCTVTTSYKRPGDSGFNAFAAVTYDGSGNDVRQNFPMSVVTRKMQRKYDFNTIGQYFIFLGETIYFDHRGTRP